MNIEESQATQPAENTVPTNQDAPENTQAEVTPAEEPAAVESTNSQTVNQDNPTPEEPANQESNPDQNVQKDTPAPQEADKPAEAKKEEDKKPEFDQEKIDALFTELKEKNAKNEAFEVSVKSRIRGGLRVMYNDMPLFLPASHFSLKRSPAEKELTDAIGKDLNVLIHEMQELDGGRKAIIVSRKQILMNEFWSAINVGDKVKGKVSSIASFGVFLDLGGVEGLIHISRLSQVHVDDPNTMFKKGDEIDAVVVELDRDKNRIALSRKELEESPWKGVEAEFPVGTQHKGIVRRLTDFGAYIELKPGVDGLLRTAEMSWTKRIKKPSDLFKPGQEVNIEVVAVSEDKNTVTLSYKKTQPNPWPEIAEKYPVNTETKGKVSQVMPQGIIVTIDNELDGFMPKSKMRNLMAGKKIPFQAGEDIEIVIADIVPDEESLILAPNIDEETANNMAQQAARPRGNSNKQGSAKEKISSPSINLSDLLSEEDRKTLFGSVDE